MTAPEKTQGERPQRCYTLDISIGADDWQGVVDDLRHLTSHIEDCGPKCSSVMGGSSSGYTVTVTHRPDMTHDKYFEELNKYLDARDAEHSTRADTAEGGKP